MKNKARYEYELCNTEATIEHVLVECPLVYDSINQLEDEITSIVKKYGLNKQARVFWEGENERCKKEELAIGIRGLIPKQSMSQLAKVIRMKEEKTKSINEFINNVSKELEKCVYEIHNKIAIFGWRRIKSFWNNNQKCHWDHREDDYEDEIAELLL